MSEVFSKNDWQKIIQQVKSSKEELGRIIRPIIDRYDLQEKEIIEVCQIGKFVLRVDATIEIVDKTDPPSPDFIISHKEDLIGLEHTRITTPKASNIFKLTTLLKSAQQVYMSEYGENVHATIGFSNDEFNYATRYKHALAEEISCLVRRHFLCEPYDLPEYISSIRTTKHSKVTFGLKEKSNTIYNLTREKLESEIRKKEMKINGYMNSKYNLSKFWLVLFVGSASAASYELDDYTDYRVKSKFDRVYLVEDFNSQVHQVY